MEMMMQQQDGVYIEMLANKALKDRTLVLNDYVDTESIYKLTYYMDKIKKYDDVSGTPDEDKKIYIELSSGGGSCTSGLFLISKIRKFIEEYGYDIVVTCNEMAASMAFMILISGSTRRMYRYSEAMFHQPLSASYGYEKMGDTQERAEDLLRTWNTMKEICLMYTDMSEEMIDDIKKSKTDRYFSAVEALQYKIVDEIL